VFRTMMPDVISAVLAGDKLLTRVSEVFKANSREIDTIARCGGEEFAIILPDTDSQGALKYAERLRKAIEKSEKCFGATVCIGVATTDICQSILLPERHTFVSPGGSNPLL
jgi:diguanylate cyclase (GGDEF)-like protein